MPNLLADRNPLTARYKEKFMTGAIEGRLYLSDEIWCTYDVKILGQIYDNLTTFNSNKKTEKLNFTFQ